MNIQLKTIRRIETEIDNELAIQESRIRTCCQSLGAISASLATASIEGSNTVNNQYELTTKLLEKKFEIRELVAKFNQENGINERTIKIAILERGIILAESASSVRRPSVDRDYRSNAINGYIPGITQQESDKWRVTVRKIRMQIQKLKDSCSGINSNGSITISDELERFLKEQQFITE